MNDDKGIFKAILLGTFFIMIFYVLRAVTLSSDTITADHFLKAIQGGLDCLFHCPLKYFMQRIGERLILILSTNSNYLYLDMAP